jgi:hypothetical protein
MDRRKKAEKETSDASSALWASSISTVVTGMTQLVAAQKPFLQSLAISALDSLQAMVPYFVTMILGQSLATLGPIAGPIAAAAVTGILQASVGVAKASLQAKWGFKEGGYTGDGGRDEVGGVVHKGEVVFEQPIVSKQKGEIMQLRALLQTGVRAKDLLEAYHGGGNFMSGWSVGEDGQLVPSVSVQVSQKMAAVQSQLVRTQAQTKMAINTMFALQRQSNDSLLSEIKSLKRAVIQSANQYEAHTYSHVELGLDSKLLSKEQHNDIKIRRAR